MTETTSTVTHSTIVRAAPGDVYGLVADVARWTVVFGPTIHVEHLHRAETNERFTIWALVNGSVMHWTSERVFNPGELSIAFRQEHSMPPVASMGGTWDFREQPGPQTQAVLTHRFSTVDGSANSETKLREALDRTATANWRHCAGWRRPVTRSMS